MVASVVVFGPRACGKTRNAERIRQALNLQTIVDDPDPHTASDLPNDGALILMVEPPTDFRFHVMRFEFAMHLVASKKL